MSIVLDGTSGINTPMYNGAILANQVTPVTAFKNRIINGAMQIDQRNAGASVTPAANAYTLDRWQLVMTQASKASVQQTPSVTETGYAVRVAAGFTNYAAITSTSAYSLGAGDAFIFSQYIEGLNVSDLAWGTASAKTVTLSALVYSSLTGTFGGTIMNSAQNRAYPFTYSIPVANTWTQISVTISGDTTGTWLTTNGIGIRVNFGLGSGATYSGTAGSWSGNTYYNATSATSVVSTNGATWYVTGVQLEVGSSATSFDYRPYGTELALCQRYYEVLTGNGNNTTLLSAFLVAGNNWTSWFYKVNKRATPTVALTSAGGWANSTPNIWPTVDNCVFGGSGVYFYLAGTSNFIPLLYASAEL